MGAKGCQRPSEAGREAWDRFSPGTLRGSTAREQPDWGLAASTTETMNFYCPKLPFFGALCYSSHTLIQINSNCSFYKHRHHKPASSSPRIYPGLFCTQDKSLKGPCWVKGLMPFEVFQDALWNLVPSALSRSISGSPSTQEPKATTVGKKDYM